MSKEFFPPRPESRPTIYAYEDTNPQYAGLLKVGLSFLLVPRYGFVMEAALLSFYYILSVGLNVWRGRLELRKQAAAA